MGDDLVWTLLAGLAMALGLAGVVVPVLPGLVIVWLAAVAYGLAVGFGPLGWSVVIVHTVLLGVSLVLGVLIPKRHAEQAGVARWSQLAGLAGAVAGFFLVPVVGVVVGAMLGVLGAELMAKGNWAEAWGASWGLARGFGVSALVDLGFGLMMVAFWLVWAGSVVL